MKKITVESLLNTDKKLISESSYESIKASGRMATKVRQAIEKQLKCQFYEVTYVSGTKGKLSHFLVNGEKSSPDKYKAHGKKPVILQEDLNAIANFISKQSPTKMIANGKRKIENGFTLKQIFQYSFKLENIDLSVRNSYVENYFELEGLKLVDIHLDSEARQKIDCNTLITYFDGWFKSLAKQYVEKVLASFSVNYDMSYYSYSDVTYDEDGKISSKTPSYNRISEEEFKFFLKERTAYRQLLSEEMTNKEKDKKVKETMEKKFQYSQVFEKYIFYDNHHLINDDFDILECNQRLEKRLIKLAIEKQNRYKMDGEPNPVEYVTYRLKKFKEYALYCEKVYNKLFRLNGHDNSNENYYSKDTPIKNRVSVLLEEYSKNKKKYKENKKGKITKEVHLSEYSKELFNGKKINDIYILNHIELFARIVEPYYEHTEKSYKAYKETSCEKIKDLGKKKLDGLPKKIQEELEFRYNENKKELSWIELLEAGNLEEGCMRKFNSENTSTTSYKLYDWEERVEEKRSEAEFFEDLKGGNNYKSKLRELGIEDSEVYNYPRLFESLTVIDRNIPFTMDAYRRYRETKDLKLKELTQKKIDAISKSEEGHCCMLEFEADYEHEEKQTFQELMDYINLELEHQIDENYSLKEKLRIVDSIVEGNGKYFSKETFEKLKFEANKIKNEYIALDSEAVLV